MRHSFWLLGMAVLAACTENPSRDGRDAPSPSNEAARAADAALLKSAIESATVSPPLPSCNQPSAASGLNILGVRLGMDAATARRILECEDYIVEVGMRQPLSDGSRAIVEMTGQREQDRFDLQLAGLAGRERVVGMLRHLRYFTEGTEPAVDQVRRSLLEKYGPLEPRYRGEVGKPMTRGFRIAEYRGTPGLAGVAFSCASAVAANGGELSRPEPECGEFVAIYITPKQSNTGLVEKLTVEITDGFMAAQLDQEYATFAERDRARAAERAISDAASRTPDL